MVKRKRVSKDKGIKTKLPDGTDATINVSKRSFGQAFQEWERKADGLAGDSIGMISPEASNMSLLDVVKNQGVTGRIKGKTGSKIKGKGGVAIFKALKTIFSKPDMSKAQLPALKALDKLMDGIEGSSADPRNVVFSNPVDWSEDTGRVLDTEPVYGHYRTDEYETVRDLKEEDVPAVSSEWYNDSKNAATPPFWQALYGKGTNAPFNSPSLHMIIKQAIKDIEDAPIIINKDNPVPIEGKKAATTALTISVLRAIVETELNNGTEGKSFPDSKVRRLIVGQAQDIKNEKESDAVESLKRINVPNDIEECWFKLSRRQVKLMAFELAKRKGIKMHFKQASGDVARSPLVFGERPDPDTEKKSLDWREMLAR